MKTFRLHTKTFGFDMWVSNDYLVTDNVNEALIFDERDNMALKEKFYSNQAGYTFTTEEVTQ